MAKSIECACAASKAFLAITKGQQDAVVPALNEMHTWCPGMQTDVNQLERNIKQFDSVDAAVNFDAVAIERDTALFTPACMRYRAFHKATRSSWSALAHTMSGNGAMSAKSLRKLG